MYIEVLTSYNERQKHIHSIWFHKVILPSLVSLSYSGSNLLPLPVLLKLHRFVGSKFIGFCPFVLLERYLNTVLT